MPTEEDKKEFLRLLEKSIRSFQERAIKDYLSVLDTGNLPDTCYLGLDTAKELLSSQSYSKVRFPREAFDALTSRQPSESDEAG